MAEVLAVQVIPANPHWAIGFFEDDQDLIEVPGSEQSAPARLHLRSLVFWWWMRVSTPRSKL
jgi:hypothetical protein